MKRLIILLLISLTVSVQAQKAEKVFAQTKRHFIAVTVHPVEGDGVARNYRTYFGLRRALRKVNTQYDTDFPTSVGYGPKKLNKLGKAAEQFSENHDHPVRVKSRVYHKWRYKRQK